MINKSQHKRIHGLLPDFIKNNPEEKQAFVAQFTGSTALTSMRDLTFDQANEMIRSLGGENMGPQEDYSSYASFDTSVYQHKYLLSLCYQKGWTKYNEKLARHVADLARLGAWLKKYGYLHKPLRNYTKSELPKLVTQFEKTI